VNFADLSIDSAEDDECCEMDPGLVIGGFVDVGVRNRVSFLAEVLYVQGGGKATDGGEEFHINYDMVQIPLLIKGNFGMSDQRARPFVVTGPGLGFRTSAKFTGEGFPDEDFSDESESFNFSWIFGGGVEVGRGAIIEVRYDLGITDIDSGSDDSAHGRNFMLLFGFGRSR
jgi:hypothetical protein